jgi:hypothetical protein
VHIVPVELIPERAGVVGFFGGQQRAGDWLMPRQLRVVAAIGNVMLDLTRARVGPGTSHMDVRAIFGSIEIIVPPNVRIECRGGAFMGNFEQKSKVPSTPTFDAPTIVVDGVAFMGNVRIRVVDPNAPGFVDRLLSRIGV